MTTVDEIDGFYKNKKGEFDLENFTYYAKACVFANLILKPYRKSAFFDDPPKFNDIDECVAPYLEREILELYQALLPNSGYCCDYIWSEDYSQQWEQIRKTFQKKSRSENYSQNQKKPSLWIKIQKFFGRNDGEIR